MIQCFLLRKRSNTEVYRRGHNGPDSKSGGEILTDFIRTLEKTRKTEKNGEKTRSYFRLFESSKSSSKNHLKKLSRIIRVNHIWRGIEEVITGLTRNQFAVNRRTWVRIPSSPPKKSEKSDVIWLFGFFIFWHNVLFNHNTFCPSSKKI